MRFHERDPRMFLVEVSDLEGSDPHPALVEHAEPLRRILDWARDYLCNPHPELGRTGPVCPFTRPSLRRELFFLAVYRGRDMTPDQVFEFVQRYRDWFLEMEPLEGRDRMYKSINVVFPDLRPDDTPRLIDEVQDALKPQYVPHGIMIGEFHPGPPDKAALWNPDFRPLRSPLPLLSIRHMVPTDFAFLKGRRDFMEAFLARYGHEVPGPMQTEVREVAARFGLTYPPALVEDGVLAVPVEVVSIEPAVHGVPAGGAHTGGSA